MSPSDKFDRFMADVRNGANLKLAVLSHAHYRAFFAAVLPIAALSEVRGAFMVNGEPATEEHMRLMAPSLSLAECRSALEVFRRSGVLERDEEMGGEWVHDFEEWNPERRSAPSGAARQKAYRERQKASRNGSGRVTRDVTQNVTVTGKKASRNADEVEVRSNPVTPLSLDCEEWLAHYEQTTGHKLSARTTKAFKSTVESYGARRAEGYGADDLMLATVGAHSDDWRRSQGYDTAESILRPTKIAALIAQGKLRTGGRQASKSSLELARDFTGGAA